MNPVEIDLGSHLCGDTWEGLTIGPILVNGEAPLAAVSSCRLHFRRANEPEVLGYGFSSIPALGSGLIEIVNALTWEFSLEPQPLPLAAGLWEWDFECIDVNNEVFTFYAGTMKLVQDKSHD